MGSMKTANAPRVVSDLRPGNHLCCLYETEEEHRALLTPYLRLGLERGEKVVYVADAHTRDAVLQYLTDDGFDSKAYLESGQLVLATPRETYLRDAPFDPDKMIAFLRMTTQQALAEGYPALRVTGEMTWALGGAPGSDRLIEYESKLNDFFPGSQCLAICQYDRRRFGPAMLLDVISTHPAIVVGTEFYDNFYYTPPAEFLHRDLPSITLRCWLKNLRARKRVEERVRRSEERFRLLVEHATDYAIFMLDPEGRVVTWNEGAAKINGYEIGEIIGKSFAVFFLPEDVEQGAHEQALRVASETGRYDFEGWRVRKDGSRFWAVGVLTALRDSQGRLIGFSKITRDLTERKQAEELDRFFTLSRDLLCTAGFDGYFKRVNPSWEKALGYSQEELLSRPYFDFIHPDDRDATIAEAQKIAAGQETVWFENRYRAQDGSYRWLMWTAAPSREKQIIYAAARDITDRKQAEEEVQRVNAQLAATNEELEAFTYSVSHDLRAPLRHVDGFSRLLLEEHGTDLPEGARRYLQRIREGAVRMGQLIDDLLNLSRIGRSQLSLKKTSLNSMVGYVLEGLKAEAQGRDIQWKIASLPSVRCDPGLLRQVFENLISNAVKFTRPRPEAFIEVGKINRNGQPVVFVRDNGVGFNMKHVAKLFGVFQRLHRQGDFEGTGVGLATVQRIIHKHGGQVWAEAAPDKGATFFFTLGPPGSASSAADGPKKEVHGE
jgi:PAS domain S-box-containing protein